jgi:hypothetical protein
MNAENAKAVLSKKSINAIADQVELRLKQQDAAKPAANAIVTETEKDGHGSKKLFLLGAASGIGLAIAAPLLGRQARPAVRGAIKGGLLAGRYFQRVGSNVKEDLQDLTAEAKATLDAEKPESGSGKGSKQSKKATE